MLPHSVGWYIVRYEPESLPYYIELSNLSHTIKFKIHFTPGYSSSCPTYWSYHLIS